MFGKSFAVSKACQNLSNLFSIWMTERSIYLLRF